jgi:hypothetical protein
MVARCGKRLRQIELNRAECAAGVPDLIAHGPHAQTSVLPLVSVNQTDGCVKKATALKYSAH